MTKAVKTAKGIKEECHQKNVRHEDYKDMLFHAKQIHHTMKTIQSNNHQLGSYELNKVHVSLSCLDDKRYKFTRGRQKFIHLWPL